MCLLFASANGNPPAGGYKLIVASNRDEAFSRPTSTAAVWKEHPYVYGGQDLEPGREGGTWLAISAKDGIIKFGSLLNLTGEPKHANAVGRGALVSNYVTGNISNKEYCHNLVNTTEQYNGFNLITIELQDKKATTAYCSNIPLGTRDWSKEKIIAVGNSTPEKPFAKVTAGGLKFKNIVENVEDKSNLVESLMNMLKCREKYWPDEELRRRSLKRGECLSSIFVNIQERGYGTRTHTVVLVDWENRMDFYETTMVTSAPDDPWQKTHISRQL